LQVIAPIGLIGAKRPGRIIDSPGVARSGGMGDGHECILNYCPNFAANFPCDNYVL